MLTFLLACLRSNVSGGGGGGPYVLNAVNLSIKQQGTTCANPLKFNVSVDATGSLSGITLTIERDFDGSGYSTVATGVLPTALPYVVSVSGFYNKFGVSATTLIRVTDETNPSNTVTSQGYTTNYTLCS